MADFYGTASDFASYCAARGYQIPDGNVEAALVVASTHIDAVYGKRYPGSKAGGRSQALGWPRLNATDIAGEPIAADEVPVEIEQATYEAALRELRAPGSLMPDYVPAERVTREQVGPISVSYADPSGGDDTRPVIGVIDGILAGLLLPAPSATTAASFFARA